MHVLQCLLFKAHIFDSLFPNYSLVMAMGHEAHYETKERQKDEEEEEEEKNRREESLASSTTSFSYCSVDSGDDYR
jgi:hypothetical protein